MTACCCGAIVGAPGEGAIKRLSQRAWPCHLMCSIEKPKAGTDMRIAVFATKAYDRRFLDAANAGFGHELTYFEPRLATDTAPLAAGHDAVCIFVNDRVDAAVIDILADAGVRAVALRCAGYNNVDLRAAEARGIAVVRVPAYSPEAVAEFTIGLLLALDRKIPRAWARVRENNFALDGLIGRNLGGRVAGVVGTGRIGALVARTLLLGFGCTVLACDPVEDPALIAIGVRYVARVELLAQADIVSLHCPLTPDSHHLIDAAMIAAARPGVQIVNTSRGALIDTVALIEGLKTRRIGGVALDVYEQEADLFFEDLSSEIIGDDIFQRLLTFPNVLITGHQAFLTEEALTAIAQTTLASLADAEAGRPLVNRVTIEAVTPR
jgi:D-lactate dehydrogenase